MKKACAALLVLALAPIAPAALPVIDALALVKLAEQLIEMKNQLQTMINQYEHMIWNARYAVSKTRWKAQITQWRYGRYGNDSGKTAAYDAATRAGGKAADAIAQISERLPVIVDNYGRFQGGQIDQRKRMQYAQMEIAHGAAEKTLAALGDVQGTQASVNQSIGELENFIMDDNRNENTQAKLMNQLSGAQMISIRQKQQELALSSTMVELAAQEAIRKRDSMASAARREQAFLSGYADVNRRTFGGTRAAITSFKGF
jgi:hypothetical protein